MRRHTKSLFQAQKKGDERTFPVLSSPFSASHSMLLIGRNAPKSMLRHLFSHEHHSKPRISALSPVFSTTFIPLPPAISRLFPFLSSVSFHLALHTMVAAVHPIAGR